jgi:hypothetical protein
MNSRRFTVALSYPGEHRKFVSEVSGYLAERFGKPRILYDKYHEAEFARPNLDVHLPSLYRTESDLIAIFLCSEYAKKRWCNLEWRSIRQLIQTADEDRIMFLSFDEVGAIPEIGIFSGDGYVSIAERTPEEISTLILQRLGAGSSRMPDQHHDARLDGMKDLDSFYLFTSPNAVLDESSVFYEVKGRSLAEALCRLFTREYADANGCPLFHYREAAEIAVEAQILFDETLDWLGNYDDPDPGIYDPQPSSEMFLLAQYGVRARKWEELLRKRTENNVERRVWERGPEGHRFTHKERPELYVSGARMLPLEPGTPETVLLGMKNRGNATARNIRLGGGNHLFTTSSFSGPLEYKPVAVDMRPDLGPGEENSLISESPQPLSKERINELQDSKVLFFHFAEGEYDGDDGTTYPIDYCYMFFPLSPTIMRVCPEKYWPKERKDRKFPGRPELFIEQVVFDTLEVGKPETIRLVIRNRGKITAHNVTIETTHAHTPASFQGPLVYETVPPDTQPSIGPGGVMTSISRSSWLTTAEGIRGIMAGSRLLFQYGRGHYEDEAGNSYPIKFCYMFDPSFPRTMVICPNQLCPKEDNG